MALVRLGRCVLEGINYMIIVTPQKFEIVLYKRYNMTKPLNSIIAFWTVIRSKRLKGLIMLAV